MAASTRIQLPTTLLLAMLAAACGTEARAPSDEAAELVRLVDLVELVRVGTAPAQDRAEPADEFVRAGVARIELDAMHLESVLLDAPGELRYAIALPERGPRLRLLVGPLDAGRRGSGDGDGPAPFATLAVAVSAPGAATIEAERVVPDLATWQELALDLGPLAGRDAVLTFRATPAANRAGRSLRLALGTPTVEGLPAAGAASAPDVVLVSLDTVRRDRLSLYGAEVPTSPSLDRIAEQAIVFDTAVAPSSWTLPSHVSLFTGQLPSRHRVDRRGRRFDLRRDADGLAASFRAAGYETIAYTAGGYVHPEFGLAVGFERYGTRELVAVDRSDGGSRRLDATPQRRELLATLAGERRRPLFVFVHTYGAHGYRAAVEDLRSIGVDDAELEELADYLTPTVSVELAASWDGDPEPLRKVYDASIVGVDALVGDLAAALQRGGRWERSYFVVFSDHGEELSEHGVFGHFGKLVEELIRVPLVLAGPGIVPGRVQEAVSLCDVAPTLRELVGLPARADRDGRSLVPYLRGERVHRSDVISSVQLGDGRKLMTLRGEELKLLAVLQQGEVVHAELFDVRADPEEKRDLARERPAELQRMLAALEARLARIEPEGDDELHRESAERASELADLGYAED